MCLMVYRPVFVLPFLTLVLTIIWQFEFISHIPLNIVFDGILVALLFPIIRRRLGLKNGIEKRLAEQNDEMTVLRKRIDELENEAKETEDSQLQDSGKKATMVS